MNSDPCEFFEYLKPFWNINSLFVEFLNFLQCALQDPDPVALDGKMRKIKKSVMSHCPVTLTAGHPGWDRGNRCALWTAWVVNLLGQRNDAWWAVPSPPPPPRDHSPPPLLRNRSAFLHPPPSARQGWMSAGEKTRWTIGSKKKIKFFIMTKRKKDDFENRRKNWIRFLY